MGLELKWVETDAAREAFCHEWNLGTEEEEARFE